MQSSDGWAGRAADTETPFLAAHTPAGMLKYGTKEEGLGRFTGRRPKSADEIELSAAPKGKPKGSSTNASGLRDEDSIASGEMQTHVLVALKPR